MWQMSRGHKLHQYSKTLHKTKVIAATGSHWFYSLLRKKSVNPHNTKNMFCLDCALIQVNIPVTISIILEKMLLVVKDNFPCPEIPAAISQGP